VQEESQKQKSRGVKRVNQIKVSSSVTTFASRLMDKFDLAPYSNPTAPCVVYGVYKADDYEFIAAAAMPLIIVWCGTDAVLVNDAKAKIINSKGAINYAKSMEVLRTLKKKGIRASFMPITPTSADIACKPRGKGVYCYIGNSTPGMYKKYKVANIKRLEGLLPFKFYYAHFNTYSRDELMKIYEQCFVGVRLLDHDGLSNSILEMGLMGRRTISNSRLPCAIQWRNMTDVYDAIKKEYQYRNDDISELSKKVKNYIDIGDKWLYVKA